MMDWKKASGLKSLNWNDILHEPSDDEHDSDETCCDMNSSEIEKGVDHTRENGNEVANLTTYNKSSNTVLPEKISNNCEIMLDAKIEQAEKRQTDENHMTDKESDMEQLYSLLDDLEIPGLLKSKEETIVEESVVEHVSSQQCTQYSLCILDNPVRCYRKYPKVMVMKPLPKRKCHSTFINNSLRSGVEEEYESLSEAEGNEGAVCDQVIVKTAESIPCYNNKAKTRGKFGLREKTYKRRGRKRKNTNDCNPLLDLKGIDVDLKVIEGKVENWITGKDGDPPSRQQAFQMLAETQSLLKLLNMHRQKRSRQYYTKSDKLTMKLLLKRADIVSVVIDKAIAEADRLMDLEETTPEQDIQNCENSFNSSYLKPILKIYTTRIDSEEAKRSNNKHVSFSDHVECHYISDSENSSLNISDELDTNDNFENLKAVNNWGSECIDKTKNISIYNKNNTKNGLNELKYGFLEQSNKQTLANEKVNNVDGENNNDLKKNNSPNIFTYNNQVVHENQIENNIFGSENKISDTVSKKNFDTSCTSMEVNDSEVNVVENYASLEFQTSIKNIQTKTICISNDLLYDKRAESNSETPLNRTQGTLTESEDAMLSETSTSEENSFGFSKMERNYDEMAWNNITIMSIKSIRIHGDDEYVPLADPSFSADDFKW